MEQPTVLAYSEIEAALNRLNRLYGRGEIEMYRYFSDTGYCIVHNPDGSASYPKFRFKKRTVFFRGHQYTIKK